MTTDYSALIEEDIVKNLCEVKDITELSWQSHYMVKLNYSTLVGQWKKKGIMFLAKYLILLLTV